MRLKIIAVIILTAILGPHFYFNYFDFGACVPIRVSLARPQDWKLRNYIKQALRTIEQYSPEDYARICERVNSIDITRFEEQWVPSVSSHAFGAYFPNPENITKKGIIKIDREAAAGYTIILEQILVHEACHAFQVQTIGDFSEPPCEDKAFNYRQKRPQDSLEVRSAEFIKQQGEISNTYCRELSRTDNVFRGECVFINYLPNEVRICATVALADNQENIKKTICADVEAIGYKNPKFEIKIPETAKNGDWKFNFNTSK